MNGENTFLYYIYWNWSTWYPNKYAHLYNWDVYENVGIAMVMVINVWVCMHVCDTYTISCTVMNSYKCSMDAFLQSSFVSVIKCLLMVDWFTFSKTKWQKYWFIVLTIYYTSNLNVPDISLQPISIDTKSLVNKKTPWHPIRLIHSAVRHNIMIWQCYWLWAPSQREDHHV